MSTVDGGQYTKGNIDKRLLEQEAVESVHGAAPMQHAPRQPQQQQIDPSSEVYKSKVQSSRMPDAVKQAMLNNPIAPPDMSGVLAPGGRTFTLEDLGYTKPQMNEQQAPQPMPMHENVPQIPPQYQQSQYQQPPQQYYAPQPPQQQAPAMSRDEIKSIIKECLAEMMVNTITENSVKNTLKTLMSEGKIRVKKKQ